MKSLFQSCGAIALPTSPRLSAILIAALAAIMRVLHAGKLKVLFPVRTFFLQRCRAVADFDPTGSSVLKQARVLHVAEIFALGDRALSQSFTLDGIQQVVLTAGFYTRSN